MIRAALAALALLSSMAIPATAQDRVLPPEYRALWAAPSCEKPAQILITSAHFTLSLSPDSARIDPLAVRAQDDGYIKLEQGNENFFLSLEGKGTLSVTALKIRNGIWPERLDPGNPALAVRVFEKCERMPSLRWPGLHPDGLAAFAAMDRILRSCAARTMNDDCARRLFAAADLSQDGTLDYREMAVAWRRALYVAAAAGAGACGFNTLFPGTSAADGPAHAAAAMQAADSDADSRLSAAEIMQTPPAALNALATPLRRLLPSLPAAPANPLCNHP